MPDDTGSRHSHGTTPSFRTIFAALHRRFTHKSFTSSPASSNGTVLPPSLPGTSLRKERGAIAAQACDTCRARKQRCDEQRPKCGTCQRFNVECHYREPQPTKKDKTLVEILDRLKVLDVLNVLENKIDHLSWRMDHLVATCHPNTNSTTTATHLAPPPPLTTSTGHSVGIHGVHPAVAHHHSPEGLSNGGPHALPNIASLTEDHYQYVSAVHQMLAWPAIQGHLATVQPKCPTRNLKSVATDGPAMALGAHLPMDHTIPISVQTGENYNLGPVSAPISAFGLDWDIMQTLSKAYFDTISLLHPILDRHTFLTQTLPTLFKNGIDHRLQSTIAFLVFALGEVALGNYRGAPINAHGGRPSGMRGGSKSHPPGITLFNEARKRLGFSVAETSLEMVQAYTLARIRHMATDLERWRSYLPSNLQWQEDTPGAFPSSATAYNGPSIYSPVTTATATTTTNSTPAVSPMLPTPQEGTTFMNSVSPGVSRVSMAGSGVMPQALANVAASGLRSPPMSHQQPILNSGLGPQHQPVPQPQMFTADLDAPPIRYPYAHDVQVALLRSRYYYAKYLIHRPFLYKALHHPDAMMQEDAIGAAECLKASLKWPIAMSPSSLQKRFVPCPFFFTQNFFGILVLLHLVLSDKVPILTKIKDTLCGGERFELEAKKTVELYVDWIRDLKDVEPSAVWDWDVVCAMYGLEGNG
ncbi:hypothetical protein NEUTE1DRAFT_125788 [Neurospora tetrasperma FGSC 2508]|uniref:Zn(2)-C6 fungal-type domain-containing protein n=1 Tax=Neurospora tetrasperma (strain FGSC 2508 / ATCC MYA-4615 / P0657) TaxID=510951 RepID=F8N192_NEUT8|nr:uncharacterized protein NEUTE1DRAFT_125788 [Neurospora tetrasperma FGSC 2508]EGO52276.1 hypothetical protein NEUTE1DRAFT_125788 [Neurospora tetrasperma FGSC 2508]